MFLLTVPLNLSLITLASDTSTLKNKHWKVLGKFKKTQFYQSQAFKNFFALLDESMSSKFKTLVIKPRIVQQGSARTTFNSIHVWNCLDLCLINQLLRPRSRFKEMGPRIILCVMWREGQLYPRSIPFPFIMPL